MTASVIKLHQQRLYVELPAPVVHELLADMVTRYESFFTFGEPTYPEGQPALLFKALSEGYGLPTCGESLGLEVIDLAELKVQPNAAPDPLWKDLHVGRILAAAFASTINRAQEQ
ncbi:hypothetical protein [Pseudomonas aeruginosa]|uniref:hypothetical protein n=1 Tax=Pseudomonas aeruginosa TaxID=287 RepID=UPI000EB5F84A|nr:hypothetical protein [Pseudomonas aeruginosa]